MDPPLSNPSAANADAALPEFGVAQDLSVFDYIDHLSPLQSVIPSNLAHCFPGLSNSSVASTSSQPKEGDKTGLESRPQSFQYSVVDVPLNGDIPAEPQLPMVSASESSAVVTSSENTSGSDVMVQAQPHLSSNDGCWDNEEVICSSILHPADRKVDDEPKSVHCVSSNMLNSSNPLDAEKDFMAEVDKEVNFSSMIQQAGVDLGTSHATSWELAQNNKAQHASNDNKKLHADLQDQSGEPIGHQNKVTVSPGFGSQNADESLSGLPVHDCSGGTFMKRSMRKLKLSDFKVSEEKHGMLRGCLQFKNETNYSKGLLSNEPGTNLQRVLIQVLPAKLTMDSYQSEISSFSYHAGKSPTVNIRKGAGFGLHLNSIAETLPIASTGTHYQDDMHNASIKPLELTYIKQTHEVQKNTEILKGVIPRNVNTKQGYEGSPGVLSNHRSSHGANKILLNKDISTSHGANKILLNEDISTESWHGKRKLKPGNNDSFDDLKENDSKRKRTDSDATGGCKRCKCKRTRCLKLYCDCFMAGIYCTGSCSCQDCSNKPEFEELVFSTRQQIMSRNPLAFSPKIVESGSDSLPNNANVIQLTPSAARHKRGCNCKKSMCFKKYCECYQAKVGCSDGCRCEGCKNIYGKRAGHSDFQEVSLSRTVQGFGGTSDEHMKADTKKTFISQTDFSKLNYHELVTESLQSTQDEVSVSSSGHLPLRSLSLPDSSMTSCNENFSRSPLNSDSHDMPLSSSSNSTRQVSYECKSHSNSSEKKNDSPLSYDAEGSHSPNNNFSASSGTGELKKDPGAQLSHDCRVGWSRSPILLGSTKSLLTNENGCNLSEIRENEPGILSNSTPVNDVNVRSLNGRRLSPRKPLLALHNLGSGTSNTLKCARKFILKSVPTSQAPAPVNAKNKEQGELQINDH